MYKGVEFSDCGEFSLLNFFIKILSAMNFHIFDNASHPLDTRPLKALRESGILNINDEVIIFFENPEPRSFEQMTNIETHNAWALCVEEKADVNYVKGGICEINAGINNMVKVIRHLVRKDITNFRDLCARLSSLVPAKFTITCNETDATPDLGSAVTFTINGTFKFDWTFKTNHFDTQNCRPDELSIPDILIERINTFIKKTNEENDVIHSSLLHAFSCHKETIILLVDYLRSIDDAAAFSLALKNIFLSINYSQLSWKSLGKLCDRIHQIPAVLTNPWMQHFLAQLLTFPRIPLDIKHRFLRLVLSQKEAALAPCIKKAVQLYAGQLAEDDVFSHQDLVRGIEASEQKTKDDPYYTQIEMKSVELLLKHTVGRQELINEALRNHWVDLYDFIRPHLSFSDVNYIFGVRAEDLYLDALKLIEQKVARGEIAQLNISYYTLPVLIEMATEQKYSHFGTTLLAFAEHFVTKGDLPATVYLLEAITAHAMEAYVPVFELILKDRCTFIMDYYKTHFLTPDSIFKPVFDKYAALVMDYLKAPLDAATDISAVTSLNQILNLPLHADAVAYLKEKMRALTTLEAVDLANPAHVKQLNNNIAFYKFVLNTIKATHFYDVVIERINTIDYPLAALNNELSLELILAIFTMRLEAAYNFAFAQIDMPENGSTLIMKLFMRIIGGHCDTVPGLFNKMAPLYRTLSQPLQDKLKKYANFLRSESCNSQGLSWFEEISSPAPESTPTSDESASAIEGSPRQGLVEPVH